MTLGILKSTHDPRVALVPATVKKFRDLQLELLLETGAGKASHFTDADYADVKVEHRATILRQADIVLSISPLTTEEVAQTKTGALLIGIYEPLNYPEVVQQLTKSGLQVFSLDMVPRTTLAQSMDVLSSMASLAGYRAALLAATQLPRYFPMFITAAGSIKPARVLVLGAGVAGLQAIATAKRLGAIVEAFDVRKAAKEEVESLGAKFVEVEGAKDDSAAGGYAVVQDEDFLKRQRAEVQTRAAKADVIITTAQVRGRQAPTLVPRETVEQMKKGAVIVDLAASTGGNCALTQDNATIQHQGVTIIGNSQLYNGMPQDASTLLSNNYFNFLKFILKDGALAIDYAHEIIQGALIAGEVPSTHSTTTTS
ncbi:MAG: NAD(P) transhydrogenase subunit alpha [Bacteroidota bacterium]